MGLSGKSKGEIDKIDSKEIGTYHMVVKCINCECESEFDIPQGTILQDFLRGKFCTVCGCLISGRNENEDISQ